MTRTDPLHVTLDRMKFIATSYMVAIQYANPALDPPPKIARYAQRLLAEIVAEHQTNHPGDTIVKEAFKLLIPMVQVGSKSGDLSGAVERVNALLPHSRL